MADFCWLSDEQWARIEPLLPRDTRGMPRVDYRRAHSGIVHAKNSGGRWGDCPEQVYGPRNTLCNRFRRWTERCVWERIFAQFAGDEGVPYRLFIASSFIKAHRTACGVNGGACPMVSESPKAAGTPSSTPSVTRRAAPNLHASG